LSNKGGKMKKDKNYITTLNIFWINGKDTEPNYTNIGTRLPLNNKQEKDIRKLMKRLKDIVIKFNKNL